MRRPGSAILRARARRGTILPMVLFGFIGLCGFVALGVDVGMMAVAKTDCQNAADAAALTGARSIDGSTNPNLTLASTNAQNAVVNNQVLAGPFQPAELAIDYGTFHYNTTTQAFQISNDESNPSISPANWALIQPANGETINLARATVSHTARTAFASTLGIPRFTISATAIAAHRPRDVSIIFDFSGSMNNESDIWNCESYLGSLLNTPNNADPLIPNFGHYTDTSAANLICTSTDPRAGLCNMTQAVNGLPAMVNDYYQSARGATNPTDAFTFVNYTGPANYATTQPGDLYLMVNNGATPAQTIQQITGASNTQVSRRTDPALGISDPSLSSDGLDEYANFQGFTQGPGYWGKTFFIWPPSYPYGPKSGLTWTGDPSCPTEFTQYQDWRALYFRNSSNTAPTQDNTKFYDSGGHWNDPSGNYTINYKNILYWIKHVGPNPFPPTLRAGRILYYGSIPDDVPSSAYTHTNKNSQITDPDQRFWKEYIDFVVGAWRDPFGKVQHPGNPAMSYGPDFTWGTVRISAPVSYGTSPTSRMHPQDNPLRPRQRFWFGPMTMLQFIADTGLNPGTAHDISMYTAKLGIAGALQNMIENHPNDMVSLALFSRPQYNNDPAGIGTFNNALITLSRNYTGALDSLWFPPNSGSADVRPWDANGVLTPRAYGDFCANTATSYGFMLAYNQFSGSNTLRNQLVGGQSVGGVGRNGAQRLVILETDGMANQDSNPAQGFSNHGVGGSYYNILPGQTLDGAGYSANQLLQIAQAICNNADGTPGNAPGYSPNPGYPGFSQPRKPVIIHTIVFGPVFEPSGAGSTQSSAVALLQQISAIGGTTFPSSSTDPTNGYKWCIGTLAEREAKLEQAFTTIMNGGISVSLIE